MKALRLPENMPSDPINELANQFHSLAALAFSPTENAKQKSELTAERLSILNILVYVGSKTVNELAQIEQVSAPAITRIVKSLEKEGYVIKAKSRADQRVVFVSATRKSKSLMEEARQARIERIAKQLAQLSQEEQQALSKLLSVIV